MGEEVTLYASFELAQRGRRSGAKGATRNTAQRGATIKNAFVARGTQVVVNEIVALIARHPGSGVCCARHPRGSCTRIQRARSPGHAQWPRPLPRTSRNFPFGPKIETF